MHKIGVGYASVTELEKKYVLEALESQRLSSGKFVCEFEKRFSSMHGNKYGVMNNSGTSSLHIALLALKELYNWDEDSEVLVPAITFIATSNAVIHAGMKVVFVDVSPKTYNIDPAQIERHITNKTKCIIPVHTFGQPCDMTKIMDIAKRHNLKIIEDCAEAHFATMKNKVVGSFSDIACFSTYVAHTITTGVGGISCTNDIELAQIMRSLIAHGRACVCQTCLAAEGDIVCPKRMNDATDRRFTFVRLGFSYRVGEIEGALGLAQLERKQEIMQKRRENALHLTSSLSAYSDYLQLPEEQQDICHSYMMYPIVVKPNSPFLTQDLIRHLERKNVETRPLLPLLNQPIYKTLFGEHIEDDYPVAKYLDNNGFYVGCHHGMSETDVNYTAKCIIEYIKSNIQDKR